MTGVTTGQTSLATATDSDDTESYLTTSLVTALQALANLFESATGHDHTGAGKGKPIGSAGIASGIHLTSPVIDSGGLVVTLGSVTVSNGVLTVTNAAGSASVMTAGGTGSQVAMQFRAGGNLVSDVVRVTLANFTGTEVASFDADGTGTTTRVRGANALALTTNAVDRLTISSAGNTVINQSGTSLGFFGHAVSAINTAAASATDLTSVIALANNLKTIGQNYGLWA